MKTNPLIFLGISLVVLFVMPDAFGLWIPLSPEELIEKSKTIFVGTITEINPVEVEYQSQIARDGTIKEKVGPEIMTLEEYIVNVEEFLKNPQDSDTIQVLRATVSGVPSGPAKISGFEIGDRVLFYLPIDEKQTHFPMQYLPESYKIPKYCDAKNVLGQPRIDGIVSFNMLQDGVIKKNNFTANKPLQFVYERDMRTLDEESFDFQITVRKETKPNKFDEIVLSEKIHAKSNPCEWIASAKTEFIPQSGEYEMWVHTTEGTGGTSFGGSFYVEKSIENEIISPLKQFKSGVPLDEIECKDELVKVIKNSDNSPACVKPESINTLIERGWTDEKFRILPILDLQSPDRIFREVGYLGLMMLLPHVEEDETVAISLEGRSNMVFQMIQRYEMDVLSNKTSADESFSSIFAKITKTNLQRFFEDEPMNFFAKHGMLFTSLGGYQDNTGTYGPFNQFLDDDESREIGDVLQYYENKRTNQEEVSWSDFVEWPTGIIKENFVQILEKRKMQETCETFSGTWKKDFATCFDFSDQYDCEGLGGIYVGKAYTGQQPDYSKKSDSFVCEFRK